MPTYRLSSIRSARPWLMLIECVAKPPRAAVKRRGGGHDVARLAYRSACGCITSADLLHREWFKWSLRFAIGCASAHLIYAGDLQQRGAVMSGLELLVAVGIFFRFLFAYMGERFEAVSHRPPEQGGLSAAARSRSGPAARKRLARPSMTPAPWRYCGRSRNADASRTPITASGGEKAITEKE